ncbi:hypothetical protein DPMN_171734 [Dreissena polymorpha]|uniref:Uncharacterized protein n=1 Tax=Dreissena polymorpha TaxID=45954 RepID=A0A9D4E282_DREPO|nr:hypothetical protein DPMN_171734 [Dreissena polymorpha]
MERDSPGLWEVVHGLNIKSLSLNSLWESSAVEAKYAESLSQTLVSLTKLETLSIDEHESPGLWEALHGLNIKSLSLSGVNLPVLT